MGGLDASENLIRLTPEDHYFAHLLLARIYGTRALWCSLALMGGSSWRPILTRQWYGWRTIGARRGMSGKNAPQFNHTVYSLEHRDGCTWQGLQSEMSSIGVSRPAACNLIRGKFVHTNGWFLGGRRPEHFGNEGRSRDPREVKFFHVDGRSYTGTQYNFWSQYGLSRPHINAIITGRAAFAHGWYTKKSIEFLPRVGRGAKWRKRLEQSET